MPGSIRMLAVDVLLTGLLVAGCAGTNLPSASEVDRPSKEPFRRANQVVVQIDGPCAEEYREAAQWFQSQGFPIAQADYDMSSFTTETRDMGTRLLHRMKISAVLRGGDTPDQCRMILSARYINIKAGRSDFQPVELRGVEGTPTAAAWNNLVDLAKSYPDGTGVLYDRK